jgi:hypothetical protein
MRWRSYIAVVVPEKSKGPHPYRLRSLEMVSDSVGVGRSITLLVAIVVSFAAAISRLQDHHEAS